MRPVTVLSLPSLSLSIIPTFSLLLLYNSSSVLLSYKQPFSLPSLLLLYSLPAIFSKNERSSYQQASRQAGKQKNSSSTGDTTTKPGNKASRQTDRLAAAVGHALTSSADLPCRPLSKLTACTTTNTIKIWFSKVGNQCWCNHLSAVIRVNIE